MSFGHYPSPLTRTLLGIKPMIWDKEARKLHPESLPDWDWPERLTVAQMTCKHYHSEPEEGCSCGIYSTLNLSELYPRYVLPDEKLSKLDEVPILAVLQLLGPTIVENTMLRSKRAYLWGVVLPDVEDNWSSNHWAMRLARKYNPVKYDDRDGFDALVRHLTRSWGAYGIEFDPKLLRLEV